MQNRIIQLVAINGSLTLVQLQLKLMNEFMNFDSSEFFNIYNKLISSGQLVELRFTPKLLDANPQTLIFEKGTIFHNLSEIMDEHGSKREKIT